jgi:hypothetical protein
VVLLIILMRGQGIEALLMTIVCSGGREDPDDGE